MVYIPKFYLDEVIRGTPHTLHPAFVVNGKELIPVKPSAFDLYTICKRQYYFTHYHNEKVDS